MCNVVFKCSKVFVLLAIKSTPLSCLCSQQTTSSPWWQGQTHAALATVQTASSRCLALVFILSSHILTLAALLSPSYENLHAKVPLLAHWSPEINNRIVKYTQGWFIELSETLKKITDVLIWSRLCRACASVSNMKAAVWKILLRKAAARKPIICFCNKDLSGHINIRYSGEQGCCGEWPQHRG